MGCGKTGLGYFKLHEDGVCGVIIEKFVTEWDASYGSGVFIKERGIGSVYILNRWRIRVMSTKTAYSVMRLVWEMDYVGTLSAYTIN